MLVVPDNFLLSWQADAADLLFGSQLSHVLLDINVTLGRNKAAACYVKSIFRSVVHQVQVHLNQLQCCHKEKVLPQL
jgi:hypothetical protein